MASGGRPNPNQAVSRRRLLTAIGTGVTTSLAGCSAPLHREPRVLNPPEIIDERSARVWEFPRNANDETIQAYLEQAAPVPKDESPATARFTFGATVFDYTKFHHDKITLRLRADRADGYPPATIFVQPLAGGFTSFRTYVDESETVVVLNDLEETGTLQFGFLITSRTEPPPELLEYRFEITATSDGVFGQRIVASDSGRFSITYQNG